MPEPDFARLAAIHAASFETPRPWSEAEIRDLLEGQGVFLCAEDRGFVLGRVILDEVELLTIAVDPGQRRRGSGGRLLRAFEAEATLRGARHGFLEVAADNSPAQALYAVGGWAASGRRRGYYRTPDGRAVDALILTRDLMAGAAQ